MRWFKRKICHWLGVDCYDEDDDDWGTDRRDTVSVRIKNDTPGFFDRNPNTNFRIYTATGGVILEVSRWDTTRQEWTTNMHIIHDDDEHKTDSIAKILTVELMR
jgi:hypothetical protein